MSNKLNRLFKSIADPTRREIFSVLVLATTTLSITQIAERFDITRQGVTKHIMMLKEAGLIEISSEGREKFCRANPEPLKDIYEWVKFYERFWDDKLTGLGKYLDSKSNDKT
ncbi:MAG: metalloregulator ArsR/SmtB family transcription factor [Bacteroidota bacterium]